MKNGRKILGTVLIFAMLIGMVGCGSKAEVSQSGSVYPDAVSALQAAWDNFAADFPVFGGSVDQPVDNGPGNVNLQDVDFMTYTLLVPESVQGNVTDLASVMHMMNANTFTAAAVQVQNEVPEKTAAAITDHFMGTQFMCGIPEKIVVLTADGYVIYAYGEAEIVDGFADSVLTLDGAKVLEDRYYGN